MAQPIDSIGGPFRLPGQGGKLLRRSKFLDGTYKVYWAPGDHRPTSTSYSIPPFWPPAGAPALMPRVVRFYPDSNVPPVTPETLIGLQIYNDIFSSGIYTNIYLNINTNAAPEFAFQLASTNSILSIIPAADLSSGQYFATDVLHLAQTSDADFRYIGGAALAASDANKILQTAQTCPRFHLRVHQRTNAIIPPAIVAANDLAYRSIFPAIIGSTFYSVAPKENTSSSNAAPYISFIRQYYDIENNPH